MEKKIGVIRSQKAYCLANAKKAHEMGNKHAVLDWEAMACAYEISLQILTEEGDWIPEEKEELITAEVSASVQGVSAGVVEALRDAAWNALSTRGWDYSTDKRLNLQIKAYDAYLEGAGE